MISKLFLILSGEPEKQYVGKIQSTELFIKADVETGKYLQVVVNIDEKAIKYKKVGTESNCLHPLRQTNARIYMDQGNR